MRRPKGETFGRTRLVRLSGPCAFFDARLSFSTACNGCSSFSEPREIPPGRFLLASLEEGRRRDPCQAIQAYGLQLARQPRISKSSGAGLVLIR